MTQQGRKPHVFVSQDEIMAYFTDALVPIWTLGEIMEHFDISYNSAIFKLEGLVHQGKLIRDAADEEGRPVVQREWRYCLNIDEI